MYTWIINIITQTEICGLPIWRLLWGSLTNFSIVFIIFYMCNRRDSKYILKYSILAGVFCLALDIDHVVQYYLMKDGFLVTIASDIMNYNGRIFHIPILFLIGIIRMLYNSEFTRAATYGITIHILIDLVISPLSVAIIGIPIG